jgi:branched-chain amino acid aminotransferase
VWAAPIARHYARGGSLDCRDGVVGDAAEAVIPDTDDGLLRGDGVIEVIRVYAGRPFALDEHLARMVRSAEGLRLPLDVEAVRADVDALLAAGDPVDGYVRVLATRGGRRIAIAEALRAMPATVAVASITYAPPRLLDGIKSLSYGGNMLATRLAREAGADEALLVTPHGRVLEAPTRSIFAVLGGVLSTPPLSDHILDSITRRAVLRVAEVEERPITLEELVGADEAFLSSTTQEVLPIHRVDDRDLGAAPGPVTQEVGGRVTEHIAAALAATA